MPALLPALAPMPTAPVRRLPESRPPVLAWPCAPVAATREGRVAGTEGAGGEGGPSGDGRVPGPLPATVGRVRVVRAGWTAAPEPGLPDAAAWSASLALAVVEALLARRPVAQLNRWLSEEVLASVTLQQRRRRARDGGSVRPVLVSARVQHPAPRVAEAAAHLRLGRRPLVLALRLEAYGSRWLCTALELAPRGDDGGSETTAPA